MLRNVGYRKRAFNFDKTSFSTLSIVISEFEA